MLNFIKSENYKLLKSKGLYITYAICIALVIAAAFILNFSAHRGGYFPYYRTDFYLSNVLGMGVLLIIIGSIINSLLTNNESQKLLKQTVSFGISRTNIYFGKLFITFLYFLLLCLIGTVVMILMSYWLLPRNDAAVTDFLLALINLAPLLIGGFALAHALNISGIKDYLAGLLLVAIFLMSSSLFYVLYKLHDAFKFLYDYSPKVLMDRILSEYMDDHVILSADYWITGLILTIVSIAISYYYFRKKNL
ncbi:hypothetical protein ERX37_01300 [Macrococcus hajekii]|uniref:ABC transporter permease n=1 Tax=Macrococcus hajekii TaxID=198482 RepID=A0A4R6BLS2_9STAP|nr:ABC transporter permease [Macrococcus hajekii]TDM02754.1 hypothetical protein ERX37_01300 [Macrococcus hajekii]GGB03609.1 hypothetical protein GCM10007190_09540 [Macrococcus hajekii]